VVAGTVNVDVITRGAPPGMSSAQGRPSAIAGVRHEGQPGGDAS
jgi:hypothetical protein